MVDGDEAKIQQMAEHNFATKIVENVKQIKDLEFQSGPGLCKEHTV